MARTLSAAHQTEIAKQVVRPALLVKIESTPAINVWAGVGDITVDSVTYTGVGDFGGIDVISETSSIEAAALRLTLSGVPSANMTFALDDTEQGSAVSLFMVFFDESGSLVDSTPITIYKGTIDTIDIATDGSRSNITVNTVNRLANLFNTGISRFTDEEQQRRFSGDLGLSYIAAIQDKEFTWK